VSATPETTGTALVIRPARPGDLPRLVEILDLGSIVDDKEHRERLEPYRAALEEIQASHSGDVLVAVVEGVVVGMCQLIVFRHLQQQGGLCAEIESVHVHPGYRNGGIGSRLLEEAVRRARDAGCYRVQLTSNARRTDAHRLYERQGFVPSHLGFKRPLA
jgi:GNAT superfamily N-acetyltransferase